MRQTNAQSPRLLSLALIAALACAKDPVAVPADSTVALDPNVLHACRGGAAAFTGLHLPGPSRLGLRNDTVTILYGATARVNAVHDVNGTSDARVVEVLPAKYGQVLATDPYFGIGYASLPNCTGVDSVWYVAQSGSGGSVRDTVLLEIRITHPHLADSDSTDVVTGEEYSRSYRATNVPTDGTTLAHLVGFAGSARGRAAAVGDSNTVMYTAPATSGLDSVRPIYESTYKGITFRDTALARFRVLQRQAPPGPYDVLPITRAGTTLVANSIGASGHVTGTSTFPSGETHAFRWLAGAFTDLGLYNGASTAGVSVNAGGDVAGYATMRDSARVALVWKASGTVVIVGAGSPLRITDDGVVIVATGNTLFAWRDGAVVRTYPASGGMITNGGEVLICFPSSVYQDCELYFLNGASLYVNLGHGTYPQAIDDSLDLWLHGGGGDVGDVFAEHLAANSPIALRSLNSVLPELVPPGHATDLGTQQRLAMDNHRSVLETSVLITTRGAFAINDYVADHDWQLVRAIGFNDRGQILAVARNSASGLETPVVLAPR